MSRKRPISPVIGDVDARISPNGVESSSTLDEEMRITMLGAGQEVGRSCCVIQYKGRTVVCDTGVHPAFSGMAALPFIDEIDWSTVDAILITHFHLDHAASLTYIMENTTFKEGPGKVYMTHPTKAVYRFLMQDFVRMSTIGTDDELFSEDQMIASYNSINAIDYHQEVSITSSANDQASSLRFTSYPAGHVLGAAMFLIEIAGVRVLYTGDYSTEDDRHLIPARVPDWNRKPDVMICESTYGVQSLEPRMEKEARFTTLVQSILKRGGRVLMPVFALGRAQELLLVLDDFWSKHPELNSIPIYYISNLAAKCMRVYQTFIHGMNDNIKSKFARGINPWTFYREGKGVFKKGYVTQLKGLDKFDDRGPCVIMASPGFMQSGVSRELFERWAPDRRNGLLVTGYSIEGTMARDILKEPTEIVGLKGNKIPRRMDVHYISFSAHVDYTQNAAFIDAVLPSHLVLVHGELNNMTRLRNALKDKYTKRKTDIQIHTPRNVETLTLKFQAQRIARAIGSLAEKEPEEGDVISGLLVSKDSTYTLLAPGDLREYTGLSTSTITERQHLAINVGWDLVKWHLEGMYGQIVEGIDTEDTPTIRIMETVDVKHTNDHQLTLEWIGSSANDMVADSVLALLLGVDSSPASVKMTTKPHAHSRHPYAEPPSPPPDEETSALVQSDFDQSVRTRIDRLIAFLDSHFGNLEILQGGEPEEEEEKPKKGEEEEEEGEPTAEDEMEAEAGEKLPKPPRIRIRLDKHWADVSLDDFTVSSDYEPLEARVRSVVDLAIEIVTPLAKLRDGNAKQWVAKGSKRARAPPSKA